MERGFATNDNHENGQPTESINIVFGPLEGV